MEFSSPKTGPSNQDTYMIGEIFEDAFVLDLLNQEDRELWHQKLLEKGQEEADFQSCDPKLDRVDFDGNGTPWGMWMIVDESATHYTLMPWTCDPDDPTVLNDEGGLDYQPVKVQCEFFGLANSIHTMYIITGYPILIEKNELKKYLPEFEVMRFCKDSITSILIKE